MDRKWNTQCSGWMEGVGIGSMMILLPELGNVVVFR
jgi:hypothetical protein